MVFGINTPDYGNTFDAFLYNAKSSTSQNSLLPPASTSTSWPADATSSSSGYGGQGYNNWNNGNGYQQPQIHKVIVGGGNPPHVLLQPVQYYSQRWRYGRVRVHGQEPYVGRFTSVPGYGCTLNFVPTV